MENKNKFLITGAKGFIGGHLLSKLGELNEDVQSFSFDEFNATANQDEINYLLKGTKIVIHLAARVHVMNDNAADPLAAFQATNLHGSVNLARQAAEAGVRRFIYVSSIKVNGEYTDDKPFTEADKPNPQDPYGVSKWQAEQALHEISRQTGMELVIVRPPLVYGAGVKANFYNLLKLTSKALPLPLGAIENRRSMIYVENLVDALVLCATHPEAVGQTYLVSDGQETSTPDLIMAISRAMQRPNRVYPFPVSLLRLAARLLGKSSVIDRLTQSLVIDSSKIRNELGWQPPYTMQQGLQITSDWFMALKSKVKATQ
jgi:nucleoside-diphosphate-sugar epimerase